MPYLSKCGPIDPGSSDHSLYNIVTIGLSLAVTFERHIRAALLGTHRANNNFDDDGSRYICSGIQEGRMVWLKAMRLAVKTPKEWWAGQADL